MAESVGAVAVGIGSIVDDIRTLRRSLIQARNACELGRRRGGGVVVSHEQGGDHTLLLAMQDQEVLDAFREAVLARLLAYDTRHASDLVSTLSTFLESGGRWQETADQLHVHVNTLRHRISRIEELTDRHLDSTPDRVDLWLALKADRVGAPRY